MRAVKVEGLRVPVSRFIYGTATARMTAGENADDILDAALEAGITTFDTARLYGEAERVLGGWIERRGVRGRVNILTKGCYQNEERARVTPADIREDLEESLEQLKLKSVDIYLLHRDDPSVPVEPLVECLNELRKAGKFKLFGGSNWSVERLAAANRYAAEQGLRPFSISSPSYSLAEMVRDPWGGSVWLSGPSRAADRRWYTENQMPVFAYSSLARGFLSGKYRTAQQEEIGSTLSWAPIEEYFCEENVERLRRAEWLAAEKDVTVPAIVLAWALRQPMNLFCILSPSSRRHLEALLCALQLSLSADEAAWLDLLQDQPR